MTKGPTQRRPIKLSSSQEYDTESPPSPTSLMVKNITRHHTRSNPLNVYKANQERRGASFKIILFLAATTCYTAFLYSGSHHLQSRGEASDPMMAFKKAAGSRSLSIATWNIAAINNNPFEYWITYDENQNMPKSWKILNLLLKAPARMIFQ